MNIDKLIKRFNLKPLEIEGGYFCRTYTSADLLAVNKRSIGSTIYYLITKNNFSAMHRLRSSDEIFHFYFGDPLEMLLLYDDGRGEITTISNQLEDSSNPQQLVPKGTWQGAFLKPGGEFCLMGVTVMPAFEYTDFQSGNRIELIEQYPQFIETITKLSR